MAVVVGTLDPRADFECKPDSRLEVGRDGAVVVGERRRLDRGLPAQAVERAAVRKIVVLVVWIRLGIRAALAAQIAARV